MALFSKKPVNPADRSVRPTMSVTGRTLAVPEEPGNPERRLRLMAEAFRSGNMGIMDYYKMQNVKADTTMRENIVNPPKK